MLTPNPPTNPTKPNVVFLISDEHRRDASGCYGNPHALTPNIDRIARSGTVFTRAYCASPLCAPSRASVQTGLEPHRHKALTHKINNTEPGFNDTPIRGLETMGSLFRRAGYRTAAFGKMHVHGETRAYDLGYEERGMRFYTYKMADYIEAVGKDKADAYLGAVYSNRRYANNADNTPGTLEEADIFDTIVAGRAVDYIQRADEKPFLLYVGLEKPHAPWKTTKRFHDLYDPARMPLPETRNDVQERDYLPGWLTARFTDEEIRHSIAAYYANVTYMDEQIGKILDALEASGKRENTIVVYCSDHGDNLYDHSLIEKHCFFEGAVGVPLVVAGPAGIPEGGRCDRVVTLCDLLPTLQELAGQTPLADLDGRSLLGVLNEKGEDDRVIFSEFHEQVPVRMALTKDWKYVYAHGKTEQLYHTASDPFELCNLASDPAYAAKLEELRALTLEGWQAELS